MIRTIKVTDLPGLTGVTIDLKPVGDESFRHLILTGPNASGKTTLLRQTFAKITKTGVPISIEWSKIPVIRKEYPHQHWYFNAFRKGNIEGPGGPKVIHPNQNPLGAKFEQLMVNKKTEAAFARDDGDVSTSENIETWFTQLNTNLGTLFGVESVDLTFNRQKFHFTIDIQNGFGPVRFNELADGHAAALGVFAELFVRLQLVHDQHPGTQWGDLPGLVFIDEIETHLHVALQESLLPFLCKTFPNHQFIVATHSPAVITSVENAVVYDLQKKKAISSSELQGIRYGSLMMSHFGIESDYDLDSTQAVTRLQQLWTRPTRTSQEDDELRALAAELANKSHSLALEIHLRLQETENAGNTDTTNDGH